MSQPENTPGLRAQSGGRRREQGAAAGRGLVGFPFDLHLHSAASDGSLPPSELVADCVSRNLAVIALSDHDTVDGVAEARSAATRSGLRVIAAVELSAAFRGELHILGYGIDPGDPRLAAFLRGQREKRRLRIPRIVDKLRALNVPICAGDVEKEAGSGSPGRPHVARALVRLGVCADMDDAFARYLNRDGPAYVGRELPSPEDAVALIAASGGRAVLAHPGCIGLDDVGLETLVSRLAGCGLSGLEAFYPAHSDDTAVRLLRMCRRTGLTATYGSDSHGPERGVPPGAGWERFAPIIPRSTYEFIDSLGTMKE
jgi:predicted metal-dependent phosphoesterase TrpH